MLAVVAVEAEGDAIADAVPDVLVAGIGCAAAAAATSAALAAHRPDLVVSAGIAGGFGLPLATVVVASRVVHADLGIEAPSGFEALGAPLSVPGADALAQRLGARLGAVLTVSTVTGTAARAGALRARYPDAVAEAMEGYGVATAAALFDVPFAEVRAISNPVGPRDRPSWRIPEALAALSAAMKKLGA